MISDYINKEAVSKMTFKEFKEIFEGNQAIAKHRMTLKEAFKELGGKMKQPKKNKEGAE